MQVVKMVFTQLVDFTLRMLSIGAALLAAIYILEKLSRAVTNWQFLLFVVVLPLVALVLWNVAENLVRIYNLKVKQKQKQVYEIKVPSGICTKQLELYKSMLEAK